jgi:general secretion pathway protein I
MIFSPRSWRTESLRRDQGFTLLEIIVALTLFASVGMAAFSWINTSFISMERITRANDRSEMIMNGMEMLRNLNPTVKPDGEIDTDSFHLSWRTEEYLKPVSQDRGLYRVAVYTVSAVISPKNSKERFEFSFLQNGYQPQEEQ